MRTITKMLLLFAVVLLLGCCMFGQSYHYTTVGGYGTFSTLPACSSTVNCFLPTAPSTLTQITTGLDGYTVGLDSAGAMWHLPIGNGAVKPVWSQVTALGTGNKFLAVKTANEIYGSVSDDSYCGTNGNQLPRVWNGVTWQNMAGRCFVEAAISPDGTFIGVGAGKLIFFSTNPNSPAPTWQAGASGSGNWVHVVAVNSTVAFGIRGTTLCQLNLTTGAYTAMGGAPAASTLGLTGDGYLFVVSTTPGTRGNIYYYNFAATSPTWVNLVGTMSQVGAGSSIEGVFGISSTSVPYHLLATGLSITNTVSGTSTCPINGCPIGSVHTASAHAYFAGHTVQTSQSSGAPTAQLNATAYDFSYNCDMLFGDPTNIACEGHAPGDVQCSKMGNIYEGDPVLIKPQIEFAFTQTIYIGPSTGCHSDPYGHTWCNFRVANFCTAATTPPDLNMDGQNVNDLYEGLYPNGWNVVGFCYGSSQQGWACAHGVAVQINGPMSPVSCTKN